MIKRTTPEFIKLANKKYNSKFDYSQTDYITCDTKVIIVCPEHGEFYQTPYQHLNTKHGCKKCGEKAAAKAKEKNKAYFIEKASAVHNNKYDYTKSVYKSAKEKIVITCPEHGDFEQLVSGHLSGYGCSKCTNYGKGRVDMSKPCMLYYLRINNTNLYKIGITTRSIDERYRTAFDRDQFTVIYTEKFSTGKEAYEKEQSIKKQFKEFQYSGEKVLRTGNTELFTKDILKKDTNE